MKLTEKDLESPLWKKLEGHFHDLLSRSQRELEKQSISCEKTQALRGRIELTRQLLKLGDRQNTAGPGDETGTEYR